MTRSMLDQAPTPDESNPSASMATQRKSGAARTIALGYGARQIPFAFDPERFDVLAPSETETALLSDEALHAALDAPINSPRLEEIVEAGDRIVVVVPDATRAAGVERIAPLLIERLNRRGLADNQISILVGGGIHRPPTRAEIHSILGDELPFRIAVHPHDVNDASTHAALGVTSRGTPVVLNRRLVEADRGVVVGAISFHYIAGFSGGRKAILPGCAAESSIQANHLLSFDRETLEKRAGIASGSLDGNPVHEDMTEAVGMLNPSFLVNSVLGEANEIVRLYAGHWRDAHRLGCDQYRAAHAHAVTERRPLVIVSAGGSPRDINLIQSHKAMEHASAVLEEGGTMVALAECGGGLGRDDFLRWFVPGGSRATALMLVDDYKINGQTAWGLRRKSERFRMLLVSALDPDTVRRTGLEPHPTLESALSTIANDQHGYIIPNGLSTLPQIR